MNKKLHWKENGCCVTPYLPIMATSLQQPLSSVPKVAVAESYVSKGIPMVMEYYGSILPRKCSHNAQQS